MTLLSDQERRLVVEAAFAGVNHGLLPQSRVILAALPLLVPDDTLCHLCQALLHAGLNEGSEAKQILSRIDLPQANTLSQLLDH